MTRRLQVLGFMAVFGLVAPGLQAQTSAVGPLVLQAPSSAQASAMGGAFLLGAGTADVLFYQPGALNGAQGVAAYRTSYGSAGAMSTVAGTASWFGGTIGVGLQSLNYGGTGGIVGTALYESDIRSGAAGSNIQTRAENVISVGYAKETGPVQVGLVGKWVGVRTGGGQVGGAAFDVGTALDAGPALVALAVRNIGTDLTSDGSTLEAPLAVSLAASTDALQLAGLDLSAAMRVDRNGHGDVIPGAGLEVAWWPIQGRTFAARVGYGHPAKDDHADGFTAGASFRGDQIGLHYAFGQLDDSHDVHRFSLTWR